jgi:ABC-type dipeptide/oligopeptide/nickel transport system permease component
LIKRLATRLVSILLLVVIGCFFAFMLGYFGPGDPVRNILGETWSTPYQYAQLRHELGLDRNVFVQFGDFLWSAMHGDLGVSWQRGQPVGTLVWDGITITLPLTLAAALLTTLLGVPLGIVAAFRHNTPLDRAIVLSSITVHAVPAYVMAPMLLVLLVLNLGWLPVTLGWPGLFSSGAVIPVVTLMLGPLVFVVRQTRNAVLEVLSEDYIRTAHAMGLRRRTVLVHHIVPNAMGPVINTTGLIFGGLLVNSIFVESIFNIPGFGSLLFNSALNQDYPLLIGSTVVAMVIISIAYFLTDVVLAIVDPRIRLA